MTNAPNEDVGCPKPRNIMCVDLGDLKEPWVTWCRTQGVKPSAAIQQIVAKLTSSKANAKPGRAVESHGARDQKRMRRELSLTESEDRLAARHAEAAGYSVPRWLLALVRAQLTGNPQIGQREQELLGESNYQLLAIGRNLNQIARHLNALPGDHSAYNTAAIEEARKVIDGHVKRVAKLVESNIERWKLL